MKRNHQITVIASLTLCLVIGVFMSSCNSCQPQPDPQDELLAKITTEKAEYYLAECAKKLSLENWHRNGNRWTGWCYDSYERLGDITMTVKDDKTGKHVSGIIKINMEGCGPAEGVLKRTGSAEWHVSGTINVSSDGNLSFVRDPNCKYTNAVHVDRLD